MTYTREDLKTMNHKRYQSFDTQLSSDEEPFRDYFNKLLGKFKPDSYEIRIGEGDCGRDIVAKVRKISNKIENIVWFQYGSRSIDRPLTLERINKIQENLDLGETKEFNRPNYAINTDILKPLS
ncbi:MAG: hypothetical protein LH613_00435 [Chamaesiphon sp.]|nr:hypothetical protein [Chamaesiphon sp.]